MDGLARLVSESLARHGFETTLNPSRLQWSKWFRCEDSFGLLLMPSQPGLFALAEEVIAPGQVPATGGKRMLALFQISESEDVGMALGRLFLPGKPERQRLASGRCFARYAIIEDAAQRHTAHKALQQWMTSNAEAATGEFESKPFAGNKVHTLALPQREDDHSSIEEPIPLPSGF